MTKQEIEDIREGWKAMDDVERWRWLRVNQDLGLTVMCDNDITSVVFDEDEDADPLYFDKYIGWDDGVFDLLEAAGIKAECC